MRHVVRRFVRRPIWRTTSGFTPGSGRSPAPCAGRHSGARSTSDVICESIPANGPSAAPIVASVSRKRLVVFFSGSIYLWAVILQAFILPTSWNTVQYYWAQMYDISKQSLLSIREIFCRWFNGFSFVLAAIISGPSGVTHSYPHRRAAFLMFGVRQDVHPKRAHREAHQDTHRWTHVCLFSVRKELQSKGSSRVPHENTYGRKTVYMRLLWEDLPTARATRETREDPCRYRWVRTVMFRGILWHLLLNWKDIQRCEKKVQLINEVGAKVLSNVSFYSIIYR